MLSSVLVITLLMQLPALDAGTPVIDRMPVTAAVESVRPTAARPSQAKATRYVPAIDGNEARYRVREQLVGFDFPNDAIGKTSRVEGSIMIGADGRLVRDSSKFTIDLRTLESDQTRRDNFIRRNTIQTDSFPNAVFVPASAQGLPATLPATGDLAFTLSGDLTIHGVTRPTTWQVKAKRIASGAVTGTATTEFKFGDFNMTIPKVGRVVSVDDRIILEYDFHLVPQAPAK
jgi:polyisoprenoid-binding protein YceI